MIPLQRPQLGEAELEAVSRVFASRWLGQGEQATRFEQAVARFVGAREVVATSSGTAALHLALASLDLEPGAEVIVPSLTFVATVQAIVAARLVPVFADIDPVTMNVSPASIARCLTKRTRAIVPVHYRGAPCAMDEILALAGTRGLVVVEDAAHAFGSRFKGRRIGGAGHVACFSFDPVKVVTCGEGGAIAFAGEGLEPAARRARRQRVLGIDTDGWTRLQRGRWHYAVDEDGFRYHMPDLNAAIGLAQLERFEAFAARRHAIAAAYDGAFRGAHGVEVIPTDPTAAVPFLYVLKVDDRAAFMAGLAARGVATGVHYIPNHRHGRFSGCPRDDLRHTEAQAERIVSLPLFTEQSDAEVEAVIAAVLAQA